MDAPGPAATSGPTENSGESAGRPRGRPFPPGTSGNPGGRPRKIDDFRELCREKTPILLTKLVTIALGRAAVPAVKAIELIFAYGWGRPNQPITGDGGGPVKFQEVRQKLEVMLRATAAGAVTGQASSPDQPGE